MNGWAVLNEYAHETAEPRRRRCQTDVVKLVAFLGTPVSELARIVGCDAGTLRQVALRQSRLTPAEGDRLAMWLAASWWRYAWRAGSGEARLGESVREAARYAEALPWLPSDWLRDLLVAAREAKT